MAEGGGGGVNAGQYNIIREVTLFLEGLDMRGI